MTQYAHTALILIDLQQCMTDRTRPPRNNPQAEDNIGLLLSAWRATDRPVIHVRHLSIDPTSGFWPGQPGAAFQDPFLPKGGEHVVDKHVTDAFANSGLERFLHVRLIKKLLIVGVSTNYSVESTARSAGCLGFETAVVSDACFTFAKTDLERKLRSAEEIHLMSLSNLAGEYASILTTEGVLTASEIGVAKIRSLPLPTVGG